MSTRREVLEQAFEYARKAYDEDRSQIERTFNKTWDLAQAEAQAVAQAKKEDPVEELVGITTIEEFEQIEEIKGSCPKCGGPLEFKEHVDTFNEDGSPIAEDTCRDPYCPSCKLFWLGQEASE